MHKKSTEPSKSPEEKALEHRVKDFMGGLPAQEPLHTEDPDSETTDEDPPERILVIPPSNKPLPANLPGAPLLTETQDSPAVQEEPLQPASDSKLESTMPEPAANAKTDEVVDDIVSQDGDKLLAAEDAEIAKAFEPPKGRSFKEKLMSFLSAWWANKTARYSTLVGLALLLIALGVVPVTRYFLLNTAGVRGSASVTVLDDSTQLPLKNVQVSLAGKTSLTDADGKVRLEHLKLGPTQLSIQKRAFAVKTTPVTMGWGSNPLGNFGLQATGAQYVFMVKDFLSGKAIEKAEASSGESSALSDKNGKIVLTVDTSDELVLSVVIRATNYREEKLTFDVSAKNQQSVNVVPARKHVFVSKRSGKYDVYKIDVDGKNEKLVLAGTGNERDGIALVSHPTSEVAALVSTRDNIHNKDGYLLSTLTVIELSNNTTSRLVQTEQIQIVGWIGNRLVYVQIAAGTSATNPKRFRLVAYDSKTSDKQELASANSFNDVMIVGDNIYYAASSNYQKDGNAGLIKTSVDGHTKKTILNQEVWNIFRVAYDKFDLSADQSWYEHKLGDTTANKLSIAPANPTNRLYADSPDNKHSLWIDQRDGKGVLLNYNTSTKTEKTLKSQSGLSNPIRWLNGNTLIYRIQTPQETADYVLSIDGGEARKIRDVSATGGLGHWYYY